MLIEEFLTDGMNKDSLYQYTNYNGKYVVIEGNNINLIVCRDEESIIKLHSGELTIKGSNLKIKELSKRLICISGEINSITR